MYVCSCRAVTDRTVRRVIGVGARSVDEIAAVCGAGSRCGGCRPLLIDMLLDEGVPVTIGGGAEHQSHARVA